MEKPFEADDPMELVGVVLPSGPEAMRDMAYVFAEEFARIGFDAPGLLQTFRDPFFAGAHQAYRILGHDAITVIVEECVAVWGRRQSMTNDQVPMGSK